MPDQAGGVLRRSGLGGTGGTLRVDPQFRQP
jgi:hypothetical protein